MNKNQVSRKDYGITIHTSLYCSCSSPMDFASVCPAANRNHHVEETTYTEVAGTIDAVG